MFTFDTPHWKRFTFNLDPMRTFTSLFFIVLTQISIAQPGTGFFDDANPFLLEHVVTGKVDYKNLIKNTSDLDALISQISSYDLSGKDEDHQLAF